MRGGRSGHRRSRICVLSRWILVGWSRRPRLSMRAHSPSGAWGFRSGRWNAVRAAGRTDRRGVAESGTRRPDGRGATHCRSKPRLCVTVGPRGCATRLIYRGAMSEAACHPRPRSRPARESAPLSSVQSLALETDAGRARQPGRRATVRRRSDRNPGEGGFRTKRRTFRTPWTCFAACGGNKADRRQNVSICGGSPCTTDSTRSRTCSMSTLDDPKQLVHPSRVAVTARRMLSAGR